MHSSSASGSSNLPDILRIHAVARKQDGLCMGLAELVHGDRRHIDSRSHPRCREGVPRTTGGFRALHRRAPSHCRVCSLHDRMQIRNISVIGRVVDHRTHGIRIFYNRIMWAGRFLHQVRFRSAFLYFHIDIYRYGTAQYKRIDRALLCTFLGKMILSPALHTDKIILCTAEVVPPTIKNAWSAPEASAVSSSASRITGTGWQRLSGAS